LAPPPPPFLPFLAIRQHAEEKLRGMRNESRKTCVKRQSRKRALPSPLHRVFLTLVTGRSFWTSRRSLLPRSGADTSTQCRTPPCDSFSGPSSGPRLARRASAAHPACASASGAAPSGFLIVT
jgi:hypothetical protein